MSFRLFLLLLLSGTALRAQNYYAGTPVYDTLAHQQMNMMSNAQNCVGYQLFFDTAFVHSPQGTQVYFKIVSSTAPAGSLHINNNVLNAGDSTLPMMNNQSLDFYLGSGSGSIHWAFIREGTPISQNDSFFCHPNIHGSSAVMVDGCTTILQDMYYPYPTHPLCAVQGPLSAATQTHHASVAVFPNPTSGQFSVQLPSQEQFVRMEIFDALGKCVETMALTTQREQRVTIRNGSGIYLVRFLREDETAEVQRVIVQ